MSQGETLLVKKRPPRPSLPKFTPLSSHLVKQSYIDPWLPQLVDAAGCPMTINTYELALTREFSFSCQCFYDGAILLNKAYQRTKTKSQVLYHCCWQRICYCIWQFVPF